MDAGAGRTQALHDTRLLILCFTAGVLLTQSLAELPGADWLVAFAAPALIPWRGRALYAALVLGALYTVWRAQPLLDERWPVSRHGEDIWMQGHIASLPQIGERATRFTFASEQAEIPRRIRVSWYRDIAPVRAGECWRLQLRMRTPQGSMNPGTFDYEAWLFAQGVGATAYVRAAKRCADDSGDRLLRWRQRIADVIDQTVVDPQGRAFVSALTLGDTRYFSDADWDAFRLTGSTHLVAISGFNIGIIAASAFFLLRWLWSLWPRLCLWLPAQRFALIGAAAFALLYALLAGFEPPVQRAVVMLWVILAAAWLHRLADASRVLLLAWFAVLLLDPFATLSAGTWLSFGAVAAIFYVTLGRLRPPTVLRAALQVQLMLSLLLAPLSLHFFHGLSWPAPLINLVAVPLFALLTPLAAGFLLLALIFPAPACLPLDALGAFLQKVSDTLSVSLLYPEWWVSASLGPKAGALSLLAGVMLFAPRGLPTRALGLICLLPLAWPPSQARRSGFELTALDVGQGLAVVVRTAHHTLVYDAGPAVAGGFDAGESIVAPWLLTAGVRRVDHLLLSHGDHDHAGGMGSVRRLLDVAHETGTDGHAACRDGQQWEWDGVRFSLLHPDGGEWSDNNRSCVLKIESADFSALLAGDIEKKAEARLLAEKSPELKADVLIAPHHGSKTSSSEGFVAAVAPKVVIHSAGWRHHFRHPRPEVVARYSALGARQFITGARGAITVSQDLQVRTWREQARRLWNAKLD